MPRVPDKLRWAIIRAHEAGKSVRSISRQCDVKRTTVQRWIQRYLETDGVANRKQSGCKPELSEAAKDEAVRLLLSDEHGTGRAAAQQLHAHGLTPRLMSARAITKAATKHARLHGKPIRAVRGKPAKRLSAGNKAARLAFAAANRKRSWANVMFTDRKKFLFTHPGAHVRACKWVEAGCKPTATTVNHPMGLNVYVGITRFGITSIHEVAGSSKHTTAFINKQGKQAKNITMDEYEEVLRRTLLPGGRRLFATCGMHAWVLQQDNDPAHNKAMRVIRAYNMQHHTSIELLPKWPPNSPDLNPIENLWSIVQRKVDAMGCKTFDEWKLALESELKGTPVTLLRSLCGSMPTRLAKCIELGGDKTPY